jgi:ThiF family
LSKDRWIHIIGAGSIGSNLTYLLAKMGVNQIRVYDFDKVEEHNVPNQLYTLDCIHELKTSALCNLLYDIVDIDYNLHAKNVRVETIGHLFDLKDGDIIVLALDSLEARKAIIASLPKNCPYHIVDLRMGGEGHSGHVFTREVPAKYLKLFERPQAELPCGQQSILYTLWNCVSEGAYYIKQILNGAEYEYEFYVREMPNKLFIANKR